VIGALEEAKQAGKARVIGYSGENEALHYAVESGRFGAMQASINICDQRTIDNILPLAKQNGMGVIAKRPLANFAWSYKEQPYGKYAEDYWLRLMKMILHIDMHEAALRFPAYIWGVDSCITGTANLDHLKKNVAMISKGKLPDEIIEHVRNSFRNNDDNWIGLV
ncbi:MAG TPA: aldo/keto reductase, partial [Ignavibacteriales bacterium]|nr:aldo/keto reductase [Ignavibacteriales bacterium]